MNLRQTDFTQREDVGGTPTTLDGSNPESRRLQDSVPASGGGPAQWWTVHFSRWLAGGRKMQTYGRVVARTPGEAIAKARQADTRNTGDFRNATAEPWTPGEAA